MSRKSTYYIHSLPVEPNKYGSKNDIPVKAIGVFKFNVEILAEYEFINLSFTNNVDKRKEEVIVPYVEFKERMNQNDTNSNNILVLWLLPDNTVFNVTNIGAEGEWWFIVGRMGIGTKMDFTQFLIKSKLILNYIQSLVILIFITDFVCS